MACFKNRKKAQRKINRIAQQIRKILETDPLTVAYNPIFYQKKSWWIMPKYFGFDWLEFLATEHILSIGGENFSIYINSVQPIEDFIHQIYDKIESSNILTDYLSNEEDSYFLINEKIYQKKIEDLPNYLEKPSLEEFYNGLL